MAAMTKTEVLKRIKGVDEQTQKQVVCALIGHSHIQSVFWGYVYCARCGNQIGDKLASVFDTSASVIVGHGCKQCRKNARAFTWKDTLLAPDPFAQEAQS